MSGDKSPEYDHRLPWLSRWDEVLGIFMRLFDYVTKPFRVDELLRRVSRALDSQRLLQENRAYQQDLERLVEERTASLENRIQELKALNEM